MWHHVTNHLIISNDKDSNSENRIKLRVHNTWDHAIDLEPDAVMHWKVKSYPMSPAEQVELDKWLEENLAKGYLRPSKSPMASPVFFIKKKDGKLRLVQDYRRLNKITIKNRYPLPLAANIVNRLTGAQHFTKFDVRWGYHNICIKSGDEWKAAIITNRMEVEPTVMGFGMTNSPAMLRFAKRCPTWTMIMWMQPFEDLAMIFGH
jgi:hypothetical protein